MLSLKDADMMRHVSQPSKDVRLRELIIITMIEIQHYRIPILYRAPRGIQVQSLH